MLRRLCLSCRVPRAGHHGVTHAPGTMPRHATARHGKRAPGGARLSVSPVSDVIAASHDPPTTPGRTAAVNGTPAPDAPTSAGQFDVLAKLEFELQQADTSEQSTTPTIGVRVSTRKSRRSSGSISAATSSSYEPADSPTFPRAVMLLGAKAARRRRCAAHALHARPSTASAFELDIALLHVHESHGFMSAVHTSFADREQRRAGALTLQASVQRCIAWPPGS